MALDTLSLCMLDDVKEFQDARRCRMSICEALQDHLDAVTDDARNKVASCPEKRHGAHSLDCKDEGLLGSAACCLKPSLLLANGRRALRKELLEPPLPG